MRQQMLNNGQQRIGKGLQLSFVLLISGALIVSSCAKIEPVVINEPAYLRVFNNLRFKVTVDNQDQTHSTLVMLINPEYDSNGIPTGAEIIGDFLVTRNSYAPPYPSHIGNSLDVYNPEYPGKERVNAGPILNGFDLSSWAQVPSGQHRVAFYSRPRSEVPFFNLEMRYRTEPIVDTVLDLRAGEVYTLHVLQKDFNTKENGILLRQENFHKLALADSLVYVNFYNMSAKGFFEAPHTVKPNSGNHLLGGLNLEYDWFQEGIREEMNVFYVAYDERFLRQHYDGTIKPLASFMTHLKRDTENPATAPYWSLPLFFNAQDSIRSFLFQEFFFSRPGFDATPESFMIPNDGPEGPGAGGYARLLCYGNGREEPPAPRRQNYVAVPNLIVTTHSGEHNPRSFATVNSIEIVNNSVYLTTVQRVYEPPVY